jgi:hypothetical protein
MVTHPPNGLRLTLGIEMVDGTPTGRAVTGMGSVQLESWTDEHWIDLDESFSSREETVERFKTIARAALTLALAYFGEDCGEVVDDHELTQAQLIEDMGLFATSTGGSHE